MTNDLDQWRRDQDYEQALRDTVDDEPEIPLTNPKTTETPDSSDQH